MQFLGRSGPDSVGTRWKEQGSSQCGERTPTIGHITGFQNFEPAIAGKFVGLLKEAAPNVSRVAVLLNPDTAVHVALQAAEAVASSLGIQVAAVGVVMALKSHAASLALPIASSFENRVSRPVHARTRASWGLTPRVTATLFTFALSASPLCRCRVVLPRHLCIAVLSWRRRRASRPDRDHFTAPYCLGHAGDGAHVARRLKFENNFR
jgi:hypothetical protein